MHKVNLALISNLTSLWKGNMYVKILTYYVKYFVLRCETMDKQLKFNIITEGQKNGVSLTCKKYNISRTLYYRWLERYKANGINGLDEIKKKKFTPVNKTKPEVVSMILNLIKKHPKYGPREIKYLLEDIGLNVSESAVYNAMKKNNLTTRHKRISFSSKRDKNISRNYPDFDLLNSGECWLCWTTPYGEFRDMGPIYEYTIFDYKSKIACSRLYNQMSAENFEDILLAVAIPVAQTLNLNPKYLCFFEVDKMKSKQQFSSLSQTIVQNIGNDVSIHVLKTSEDLVRFEDLRKNYTHQCLSFIIPLINNGVSFNALKIHLQNYIRDYNINFKQDYGDNLYSPVEYHVELSNSEMILPLWAYIERQY